MVMDAASLKVNQSGTKESEDDTSSGLHFAQECNVSASRIYCHYHGAMPRMTRKNIEESNVSRREISSPQ